MVFRRNRNFLRPVNSVKHIIDVQGGLVADTNSFTVLALGDDNPVLTSASEVQKGCKISSIYLDVQIVGLAAGGVLNNVYMYVFKNPAGLISTFPEGNKTGVSEFKKQIFHTEMKMTGSSDSDIPQSLFKGVLRIPQRFQRMGALDTIGMVLYCPAATANFCIQCIYKEYR